MALKRQRNWHCHAYHEFLLSRAHVPFKWGEHDCALFAADGVLAMTGVDIAAEFRGKYSDEAGALAAIKAIAKGATVADAAAWCAQNHGLKEWTNAKFAQRGDLVVFNAPTGSMVAGLVHLSGQIVAAGEASLYNFPISKVLRAWHV